MSSKIEMFEDLLIQHCGNVIYDDGALNDSDLKALYQAEGGTAPVVCTRRTRSAGRPHRCPLLAHRPPATAVPHARCHMPMYAWQNLN